MIIPERVKDILEEIANRKTPYGCSRPVVMKQGKIYEVGKCICDSCLATEALKLIVKGEKNSLEESPGISLENFSIRYTLADAHWQWVESMCEKMYKEAFVHGFKHGVEHKNPSRNEKWDDEHISEM